MTSFLKRKKLELQNHLLAHYGIGFQLKNDIIFVREKWILVLSSVVDPKLFISDPDPTLTLISDPDPNSDPDPACL
jgi:hypothetical protein